MNLSGDVLVAGAGPAGSACALQLARAGFAVRIVDRAQFPRAKVCGDYLNAGALEALDELGMKHVLAPSARAIGGLRLFGSGAEVELAFETPAWSLDRLILDDVLLRAAMDAGAAFERAQVEAVRCLPGKVEVDVRDTAGDVRTFAAAVLVAADGANSTIARKLGLPRRIWGPVKFALGGTYEGFARLDDRIEMYVARHAYFAINPLTEGTANVMIVVEEQALRVWRDDVEGNLRKTARDLGAGRRSLEDVRIVGKRVAVGPLLAGSRPVTCGNVLFAGDAAAFVDPFTGQGVYLALRSAAAAARAAGTALRDPASRRAAWDAYAREHRDAVRERRRVATVAGLVVRNPLLARASAAIARRSAAPFRKLVRAVSGSTARG